MMKGFTGVTKNRTRGGRNNEVNAWVNCVEGLPAVHERLRRVLVLNRDALGVIAGYDRDDALIYCDPPYVHATRTAPEMYSHEMTDAQHRQLLALIKRSRAKVTISGYANEMYDGALAGWRRRELDLANHSAGGREKQRRVEVLWWNFAAEAGAGQG
jgi:DNA adenine methylase